MVAADQGPGSELDSETDFFRGYEASEVPAPY